MVKIKIGDTVRITDKAIGKARSYKGKEFIVSKVNDTYIEATVPNDGTMILTDFEFELVKQKNMNKINVKDLHQYDGRTTVVKIDNKEQHSKLNIYYGYMTSYDPEYNHYLIDNAKSGYGSKDSYRSDMYIIINFNDIDFNDKEIIGYKLIDLRYASAVRTITSLIDPKDYFFTIDYWNHSISLLKEAKVLDIWFEPVYKQNEFKIGDWIINTDCEDPTADKIVSINDNYYKCLRDSNKNDLGFKKDNPKLRLATEEEIKKVITKTLSINCNDGNIFQVEVSKNTILVKEDGGQFVSYEELNNLINAIDTYNGYFIRGNYKYRPEIINIKIGCKDHISLIDLIRIRDTYNELNK